MNGITIRNRSAVPALMPLVFLCLLSLSCATEKPSATYRGNIDSAEDSGNGHAWEVRLFGNGRAEMVLPCEQKIKITGEARPTEEGGWIFYTDSLSWFGNWEKGWTEAEFSLTGSVRLPARDGRGTMTILEKPAIGPVASASVRYGESRYYGDRAAGMVERRWLRIERTALFAGEELEGEASAFSGKEGFSLSREYGKAVESLLFPEVFGPSREFPVPREGEGENRYEWGEGYEWDRAYSLKYLPEELRPVRDSGTLYRDYIEGRGLFFLAMAWGEIWETIPLTIIEQPAAALPKE